MTLIGTTSPGLRGAVSNGNKAILHILLSCCPVGWGRRIHRLLLCRGIRPPLNECPRYDTKQSDDEVPVMLELWGMQSTLSLPSILDPLWPGLNRIKLNFCLTELQEIGLL